MLYRIDTQALESISDQLVYQVKAGLARGELAPGDRLPSVRELARELAINPNTVSRTYQRLESDGVIVRRQGAGCFVREGKSALSKRERDRRLSDLLEKAVTEAVHLKFEPSAIRTALEAHLAKLERERSVNEASVDESSASKGRSL